MSIPAFPLRQIHLDFHTSPLIPDVGADWDAAHFIETLQRARVNSVTVFAKCHHGMNYYPSKVGPVHPSLKFDLLGEQIEACHRAGIRCPIYISVGFDESAAERHPEWRQVDINGKLVGRSPLEPGWAWMCVGTEYADELVAQTEELLNLYECDGFFYDILMYHPDGSLNPPGLRRMREMNLDPANPNDRRKHNHFVARQFMERTSRIIRDKFPEAGIFYNSRWGAHFIDEAQYYSQVEIESLPTGGWGYGFYPLWSRYGRLFGKPMLGMTGRFHRTWADWGGLKHPDALKMECGGIVATGGAISIGDQLHPRGRLNEAVYEVIGEAYRDIEAIEEFCIGAEPQTEIGLLILNPALDKAKQDTDSSHIEGAAKLLNELHLQFDVITERVCPDFSRYDLLVIPDRADCDIPTVERLQAYVAGGGKILLSHNALRFDQGEFLLSNEMGVDYVGAAKSDPDYFVVTHPSLFGPAVRKGFAYSLYDGPTTRVSPRPGTEILADAYETYFNRTGQHFISHGYTCPLPERADYPAITRNGNVIYVYGPIFSAYYRYGAIAYRDIVGRLIDLLLPEPLVETNAPATAEVTLLRQGSRQIVHIVNYHAQRRGPNHVEVLEKPVPLRDVTVRVNRPEGVQRAYLAGSKTPLPHFYDRGRVSLDVPHVDAHAVVVIE